MKEELPERIGIWFPKSCITVIHFKGSGKPYIKIVLNEKSGYEDYSFIWPKDKMKTDRERRNWRCIFMPAGWKMELRKYKKDENGNRVIADIKRVSGRELSEIMKKQTGGEK
ncbi:MAG: hypothetical protein IKG37_02375 [Solobacterium sp.]|jgi:hypothetical protein|nr:hypothetical protein [Solobacterium sp.]